MECDSHQIFLISKKEKHYLYPKEKSCRIKFVLRVFACCLLFCMSFSVSLLKDIHGSFKYFFFNVAQKECFHKKNNESDL